MSVRRRELLVAAGSWGAAGLVVGLPQTPASGAAGKGESEKTKPGEEEDVSPEEDLMREHGVLRRVLLIYDEALNRLHARQDLPLTAVADAAAIVRTFIEDYHEKLEEDFLFPCFRQAGKQVDLVNVLFEQHQAGRALTNTVTRLLSAETLANDQDRARLTAALEAFRRMYRPHAAREDTVLFPALEDVVDEREYDRLGREFEKRELQLFGAEGFEKMVDRVAVIEKSLGIYDLAQFTPHE